MNFKLDPEFFKKLKKLDVRISKSFKEKILIFANNPNDSQLNNHELRKPYEGLRSIDITEDYRAIYEERKISGEKIAYFTMLGTHKHLYRQSQEN